MRQLCKISGLRFGGEVEIMFVGQSPEEICFSPHLIYLAEVESQFTMCLLFGWVLVPREKVILRVCSNDKELSS